MLHDLERQACEVESLVEWRKNGLDNLDEVRVYRIKRKVS